LIQFFAQIQAHCGKIAAELEAAGALPELAIGPGSPQNAGNHLGIDAHLLELLYMLLWSSEVAWSQVF
jgi:hypothetical protein